MAVRRNYFYEPETNIGRCPPDQALGLVHSFSPAWCVWRHGRRYQGGLRVRQRGSAGPGRRGPGGTPNTTAGQPHRPWSGPQLEQDSNTPADPVPILYAEVDGTGVPMVAEELAGRSGKQVDGSAKTREVKLGAIFTQTKTDEDGLPVRDHASTTYVGSFECAQDFGSRIRAEGRRRGLGRATKWSSSATAQLGLGTARVNFPAAMFILDLYHALERLNELCADSTERTTWVEWMAQT